MAAYTRMAVKLFQAGVLEAYRPLLSEEKECVVLIKLIQTTEETSLIETSLKSLQEIINVAGDTFRDSIIKKILTTVKSLFSRQERSTRLEAGRCMDSLVRHLPAEDLQALLREASGDDIHEHQDLIWTIKEVLSIRSTMNELLHRPAGPQAMQHRPAGPQAMQQRPAGPPNVQQQRQPGPGQQAMQQQRPNAPTTSQFPQGMAQRPGAPQQTRQPLSPLLSSYPFWLCFSFLIKFFCFLFIAGH